MENFDNERRIDKIAECSRLLAETVQRFQDKANRVRSDLAQLMIQASIVADQKRGIQDCMRELTATRPGTVEVGDAPGYDRQVTDSYCDAARRLTAELDVMLSMLERRKRWAQRTLQYAELHHAEPVDVDTMPVC